MDIIQKYELLKDYIRQKGKLCVAFSGGVDSTFLVHTAFSVLNNDAMAVTVRSSMCPQREFEEAGQFAASLGVKHTIIDADEYEIREFVRNSRERCYYCKHAIFTKIKNTALENGIEYVADGSNMDDDNDYRPGMRAIKELGILSPLKHANLTKSDIRQLSREMGLKIWNKPAFACLASRIPYGIEITREKLKMVEEAENYLMDLGFRQFRVRYHQDVARIELPSDEMMRLFTDNLSQGVVKRFKEIGFVYVAIDLEGYRMGSMNEVLA